MAQTSRGRASATADTLPLPRARRGVAGGMAGRRAFATSEALTFPLAVGMVHWLIVQLAASFAFRYGEQNSPSPPYQVMPPALMGWAHVLVEPFRQWDGLWYKLVAETGYGGYGDAKAAFWPLFPWLMRAGHRLTGVAPEVAGYVVANVCFLGALMLLYRLVSHDFDRAVARRTLVALALFPTAFFFSAVYTESLFLLLVVAALLAARLGNWWLAGLAGLLAALTRSNGVFLLLPFAVLFLQQHRLQVHVQRYRPQVSVWFPDALFAALPILGPVAFAYHLEGVWNDPMAFVNVQQQWDRIDAGPLETFRMARAAADWSWVGTFLDHPTWETVTGNTWREHAADSDTLELVCTVGFIALAVVGLRLLPLYQSAYVLPGLVVPLFQPSLVHPLFSIPRFGLVLFPLFIVISLLVTSRRVGVALLALSTLLLVLLTAQFVQWYWVS